jgi:type II secretory pathway pseudopilin PulG
MRIHHGGFTYVWALIAVAVTSAVLAAGAELMSNRAARHKQAEYAWVIEQYRIAIRSYSQATASTPDAPLQSLQQLVRDDRAGIVRRHIRQLYPNPLTGKTDWQIRRGSNGEALDVVSASGGGLGERDELGRVPLHEAVQRGLLGAAAPVVQRHGVGRALRCDRPMGRDGARRTRDTCEVETPHGVSAGAAQPSTTRPSALRPATKDVVREGPRTLRPPHDELGSTAYAITGADG